jgi:pimeloyl-ACP methyl ester carboxylesterase
VGEGTPVVIVPTWLTHLEHDWESPTRAQLLRFLSNRFQIIRYDGRGFGLSDRNVQQISFETLEQDLETVVDALGLRSYALLGISQGAATAISHAARHTDRVAKLVLHGGFALGRDKRTDSSHAEMGRALGALLRQGLDKQESAYLRIFNSVWYPGASNEQVRWYADLLRTSASEETYLKNRSAAADIDVRNLLPRVQAPTLVLQCRYDNAVPFDEGRRIATSIPNAKLVSLNSENHVPLSGEAAMNDFLREIGAFLSD